MLVGGLVGDVDCDFVVGVVFGAELEGVCYFVEVECCCDWDGECFFVGEVGEVCECGVVGMDLDVVVVGLCH